MAITMIGLDSAKPVFQVHGIDVSGRTALKRKLRRSELVAFFERQPRCTVVIEACGAGHHWARLLSGLGHEVKLIAPEAVRPFVKRGNKNDAADAAALCEAGSRPEARFRADQERGAASRAGAARGQVAAGQAADDAGERHTWLGIRVRPHRAQGLAQA